MATVVSQVWLKHITKHNEDKHVPMCPLFHLLATVLRYISPDQTAMARYTALAPHTCDARDMFRKNQKWTKHNRVIMYRATSPYPAWGLPAEHAWDAGKNAGACNTTKCKNLCGVLSFFEGYCYPGHVKTCPNSLYQQGFWSSPLLFQHLPSVTKTSGGWKNRGNIHKDFKL
jgi:hypothetical protein